MSAIKNISYFLIALVFAKAVGSLQSFLLAHAFGPENFGVWVTLLLVGSYIPIVSLGAGEALVKKVPYFLGRKEMNRVHEVESSVLGALVITAFVIVILAILALLILPLTSIKINRFIVALWLCALAVGQISVYFYQRFMAYENFKMNGAMDAFRSVMAFLFVAGSAWVWGLPGAVFGYFLHETIICGTSAFLSIRAYGAPGITFRRESIIAAIRVGFPITLLLWVLCLTVSVDRVVLGGMIGAKAVGYYGFGLSLTSLLGLLPGVVGRVLYPKLNKQFGERADSESMKRLVVAPTLAVGTLSVNVQAALVVAAPILYGLVLPKYHPGLLAGQILILGSYFGSLLQTGRNYLVATNHERVILKYIGVTLIFNLVFDVGFVRAGFGTAGVAAGTSIAGLLLTSLVWRRVLIGLGFTRRGMWSTLCQLFLPVIALSTVFGMFCIFDRPVLEKPSFFLLPVGIVMLLVVNGILWCFPVYRAEAVNWKRKLRPVPSLASVR